MLKCEEVRLRHMLDAAHEAVSFAAGKQREDLDNDRMLVLALAKFIEIIGEAAGVVAPERRARYLAASRWYARPARPCILRYSPGYRPGYSHGEFAHAHR